MFRNCGIVEIVWSQRIIAGITYIVKRNGYVISIVEKRFTVFISHGGIKMKSIKNFLAITNSPKIKLVQLYIISFKEKCGKRIYQRRNRFRIVKLGNLASS